MIKEQFLEKMTTREYLANYLEDLEYWKRSAGNVDDVNFHTSGTPSFLNLEGVERYIKPLRDLLNENEI